MQEQQHHAAEQQDVNQNPAQRAVENFAYESFIAAGAAVEGAVKPAKEPFLTMYFAFVNRF